MNKLVIATGSNIGDSVAILESAKKLLVDQFGPCESSRIYCSSAVDYLDQPDFFNQVLLFELPSKLGPQDVMTFLLETEKELGRERKILRGPRTIDMDIIFFGDLSLNDANLTLPHPRFLQRSFVIRPMLELSISEWLFKNFPIPEHFDTDATPIS